ncbi:HYPK_UBA domain-containing protein [Trichoderma simmonsii]|uniref:HYPK_UBA domain-containing protein n=1 Tax=Trichoderma simmonsii TaxID=1491479 RepID=A0A8G0L6H0_9HYPO|nr:HYPK_UBA domain-containing protein [Trichoderma simmonsii]
MSNPEDASDAPPPPQSAEDRKAASALAALDTPTESSSSASAPTNLDQEAVSKAMRALNTAPGASATAKKNVVKVDAADVALLVDQLDVTKSKATELLKAHEGDAVAVMRAVARG